MGIFYNEVVTVILPFHIKNQYLNEAIESCLSTKNCPIRLLLIDTRRQDIAAQDPIQKYKSSETILAPQKTYLEAIEIGVNKSETNFIAIMNSDDLVAPDRFSKQMTRLIQTNSDLCITNIRKFSKKLEKPIPPLLGKFHHDEFLIELLLFGSYGADATWLFTKNWAIRNEVFSHPADISDWLVALRVFPKTRICKVNEELYFYRMHKDQVTRKKNEQEHILVESLLEFNKSLGLPSLNYFSASALAGLARPTAKNYFLQIELSDLEKWFNALLNRNPRSIEENIMFQKIFRRRLLLVSLCNIRLIKYINLSELLRTLFELYKAKGNFRR